MAITDAGEERAWETLRLLDPASVCGRAAVGFDAASGAYLVPSFGRRLVVAPGERRIGGSSPVDEAFLERHADLLRLTLLWYLVKVSPAGTAGALLRPSSLPGGGMFLRGSHVLPLPALARRYASRPGEFLAAGLALGGRPAPYGSAAVELPALPKVPVTAILWVGDEEFAARADLLFDASAPRHLPTDVLWAVATLCVRLL